MVVRCKIYELINFFPSRTVALAALCVVMKSKGLLDNVDLASWTANLTGSKVDYNDLKETVELFHDHHDSNLPLP